MNVVKLLGESTQVNAGSGSSVPSIDGIGAQYVLLQHDHTGGQAHIVEVRTGAGVTTGSFHLAPHNPITIQKERTDLVYCSSTDVYATSVVYKG
tara:strand:+ start:301 stop:582 length:282 start_codon:yes stop_codon:yes gene_type:complete